MEGRVQPKHACSGGSLWPLVTRGPLGNYKVQIAMEPVFTLPYSEFCVAQQLARWLPASKGFSLFAPFRANSPESIWFSQGGAAERCAWLVFR